MSRTYAFAAALAAAGLASPADGQYRMEAGDTLRYREHTTATIVMRPPTGEVRLEIAHDARVAVTFGPGGDGRAWFEALSLERRGSRGDRESPDTGPLLGRTFSLHLDAGGRVEVLAVPEIPAEISGMTDLTRQFEDFFISVPPGELFPGREWADTVVNERPGRPIDTYRSERIRRYRVESDTVVGGVSALRIHLRQEVTLKASSRMEEEGMTTATLLSGSEDGTAVFAPAEGRLLGRTRTGSMRGEMSVTAGDRSVAFPQEWHYVGRMDLAPRD